MNNTLNTVNNTFNVVDYVVFSIMLGFTVTIGLYFGFYGKKQGSPEEYMYGGRKMKLLPIVASLIASDVTGISILGIPSEVYVFGSAFKWSVLSIIAAHIAVLYVYLPVFYRLQVTSSFEYLNSRFSSRIRSIASVICTINNIFLIPIVIYTAVLSFGQVSQINLDILSVTVCMICTVYTTLGGIKAVVWADTLQMCGMVVSLLVVLFLGVSVQPGGFTQVWKTALEGHRLDFNSDFDPTNRTAAFANFIGLSVLYLSYGYNPMFVQRYLSLPTEKKSKLSAVLFVLGLTFFRISSTALGVIIYSRYSTCDPVSSGIIQKLDQLVPYYIMEVASTIPGFPGVCIAGIFCASISSMSSMLNTSAGTIYEDFIKDRMPANTSNKRASDIMKIIAAVLGVLSMVLIFAVQHLGGILELFLSIYGVIAGPVIAMFMLGMLVPIINEKGIFYGSITGTLIMMWISTCSKYYAKTGQIINKKLPISTEGCLTSLNVTISNMYEESENTNKPFYLYRISFHYYALMGVIATTMIAFPVSWFTRKKNQIIDPKLFSPVIHKFISKYNYKFEGEKLKHISELEHLNQKKEGDN